MAARRRWLQFSLRGFLVVLTLGCLWQGWKVERARKRGEAIDAIVDQGGLVIYQGGLIFNGDESPEEKKQRFWLDLAGNPVNVYVWDRLSDSHRVYLPRIYGIGLLCCDFDVCATRLPFLYALTNANELRWESGRIVRRKPQTKRN